MPKTKTKTRKRSLSVSMDYKTPKSNLRREKAIESTRGSPTTEDDAIVGMANPPGAPTTGQVTREVGTTLDPKILFQSGQKPPTSSTSQQTGTHFRPSAVDNRGDQQWLEEMERMRTELANLKIHNQHLVNANVEREARERRKRQEALESWGQLPMDNDSTIQPVVNSTGRDSQMEPPRPSQGLIGSTLDALNTIAPSGTYSTTSKRTVKFSEPSIIGMKRPDNPSGEPPLIGTYNRSGPAASNNYTRETGTIPKVYNKVPPPVPSEPPATTSKTSTREQGATGSGPTSNLAHDSHSGMPYGHGFGYVSNQVQLRPNNSGGNAPPNRQVVIYQDSNQGPGPPGGGDPEGDSSGDDDGDETEDTNSDGNDNGHGGNGHGGNGHGGGHGGGGHGGHGYVGNSQQHGNQPTFNMSADQLLATLAARNRRKWKEPKAPVPVLNSDTHFDSWCELMHHYFDVNKVPVRKQVGKAWEGIPQDRQQEVIRHYVHDRITSCQTFQEMVDKLRVLFDEPVSIPQREYEIGQTPQTSKEKLADYIDRKSKEIFAKLPQNIYSMNQHCNLIARGIFDYRLLEKLVSKAMTRNIKFSDFRRAALTFEAVAKETSYEKKKREMASEIAQRDSKPAFVLNKPRFDKTRQSDLNERIHAKIRALEDNRSKSSQRPKKCYECNSQHHIRPDCSIYKDKLAKQGRTPTAITKHCELERELMRGNQSSEDEEVTGETGTEFGQSDHQDPEVNPADEENMGGLAVLGAPTTAIEAAFKDLIGEAEQDDLNAAALEPITDVVCPIFPELSEEDQKKLKCPEQLPTDPAERKLYLKERRAMMEDKRLYPDSQRIKPAPDTLDKCNCLEIMIPMWHKDTPQVQHDVQGVVDSGANVIAVPRSVATAWRVPVKWGGKTLVKVANNHQWIDRDMVKMRMQFGKKTKEFNCLVMDTPSKNVLLGTPFLKKFNLLIDIPNGTLRDAKSGKVVTCTPAEHFRGFQIRYLNEEIKDCKNYFPGVVQFKTINEVMLAPMTTSVVRVRNDSLQVRTVNVLGDKHLFIDKLVKPLAAITSTDLNSILLTNLNERPVYLPRGRTVAFGSEVEDIIQYEVIPDNCDHPASQSNSPCGFIAVPKNRVQQKVGSKEEYLKENYSIAMNAVLLDDIKKQELPIKESFDPEEGHDKFFGKDCDHTNVKVSEQVTEKHKNARAHTKFEDMEWESFNINPKLSESKRARMKNLLYKYRHMFAYNKLDIADVDRSKLPKVDIDTGDHLPIRSTYYRRSPGDKSVIEKSIELMIKQKVIQPSESPWSSPVVIVMKKNGDIRFCCDYRRLNKITKKDSWPLPRIDEALDSLSGSDCFSSLDMFSGYWMLPLSDDAREKSAFITHMGLFEWKVLPFGLTCAPAKYQRMMDHLLRKLKWKTCALYLDDVCVFSKGFDQQLTRLEEVFRTLDEVNLKMNPSKCFFAQDELEYLGHTVSGEGTKPSESKIKKVREYSSPRNVPELRSFLGLAGYYRNYVNNFAKLAHPLFHLLKKDNAYEWTKACQTSFEKLKEALVSKPILTHFDDKKEHAIFVDACGKGIGAILKQAEETEKGDMVWKVVSYWGRALKDAETRYPATELELLGVVNACHYFRSYIHGQKTKVFTDHRALLSLCGRGLGQSAQAYNRRVNTWQMKLADFDLEIIYRPGKTHQDADALSRMPQPQEDSVEGDEEKVFFHSFQNTAVIKSGSCTGTSSLGGMDLVAAQAGDTFIQYKIEQVKSSAKARKRFRYDEKHKILFRWVKGKLADDQKALAIVVARSIQHLVVKHFHDSLEGGHRGAKQTKSKIRRFPLWFPAMDKFVERYVRHCKVCQVKKGNRPTPPPPISLHKELNFERLEPFDVLCLDLVDFHNSPSRGYNYIVNCIDLLTCYIESAPLKKPTGNAIANFVEERFILRGHVPKMILTDRGINLTSGKFKEKCEEWNVKLIHTSRYNPRCNGKVEKANGDFKKILKTIVSPTGNNWSDMVKVVTSIMNRSIHSSTGYTPHFLVHGQHPKTPLENKYVYKSSTEMASPSKLTMQEHWNVAREKARKSAEKWADKPAKKLIPVFKVNDRVLIYKFRHAQGASHALVDLWEGPFTVVHAGDHHNYVVVNEKDPKDRRSVNVSQMKKYYQDTYQVVIPDREIIADREKLNTEEKAAREKVRTRSQAKLEQESYRPATSIEAVPGSWRTETDDDEDQPGTGANSAYSQEAETGVNEAAVAVFHLRTAKVKLKERR